MVSPIFGFSKKNKEEKIQWLVTNYLNNDSNAKSTLTTYWNADSELQNLHDDFIENTLTNYYLPFGIAPNFLINDQLFALPMVTEESSVVAAASNAAKFWLERGGFKTEVISTIKNGQVYIDFLGDKDRITSFFHTVKPTLLESISSIEKNMKIRGGGLLDITLEDNTQKLDGFYQLHCTFETLDAMGANFINSCLECIAKTFESEAQNFQPFKVSDSYPKVIMSILSNYVPECLVKATVQCSVLELSQPGLTGEVFANKFKKAVDIAQVEPRRAVTHNKGIMNGIDAVVIATGNDFRAVEAGVHAYASKEGTYRSLTHCSIEDGIFTFWIEIPMALGTVGGLTSLHPLVKLAFDILQKPDAQQLMQIVAATGLAQNFAAIKSLITTGIQQGHMKMHLVNILNQLEATTTEKGKAIDHFTNHTVSHASVAAFISTLRT